jgi:hypothetical protein
MIPHRKHKKQWALTDPRWRRLDGFLGRRSAAGLNWLAEVGLLQSIANELATVRPKRKHSTVFLAAVNDWLNEVIQLLRDDGDEQNEHCGPVRSDPDA